MELALSVFESGKSQHIKFIDASQIDFQGDDYSGRETHNDSFEEQIQNATNTPCSHDHI